MGMSVGENYSRIVVDCFELTQADGGGMSEEHIAYISSQVDGQRWVEGSQWPRYCRRFYKVFTIAHNLEALTAIKEAQERDRALAKLTDREKELLGL